MVFVTGGTGFIGAYIISNLVEKGYRVRALRRSGKLPFFIDPSVWERVEWVEGDLLDVMTLSEATRQADAVVHAAAVVSFSRKERSRMYKVNVEGTANIVNAALENKVRRFVHISSVAALGRTAQATEVSEEKKWEDSQINTHYAISKHLAEIQAYRGFAEGLEGLIVNPSTVLGYGDWHQSSCTIFKNVYKGFPWYTRGTNGFVGVEDVAEASVRLLQSDLKPQRLLLNAENWTFQQLFNTIALHFDKPPPRWQATPLMGAIAWRLEAIRSLFTAHKSMLTKETARVAHSNTFFSNAAILEALPGFSFAPLDIVIKKSCEKYEKAVQRGLLSF